MNTFLKFKAVIYFDTVVISQDMMFSVSSRSERQLHDKKTKWLLENAAYCSTQERELNILSKIRSTNAFLWELPRAEEVMVEKDSAQQKN